jgi:hypothetical protein
VEQAGLDLVAPVRAISLEVLASLDQASLVQAISLEERLQALLDVTGQGLRERSAASREEVQWEDRNREEGLRLDA